MTKLTQEEIEIIKNLCKPSSSVHLFSDQVLRLLGMAKKSLKMEEALNRIEKGWPYLESDELSDIARLTLAECEKEKI